MKGLISQESDSLHACATELQESGSSVLDLTKNPQGQTRVTHAIKKSGSGGALSLPQIRKKAILKVRWAGKTRLCYLGVKRPWKQQQEGGVKPRPLLSDANRVHSPHRVIKPALKRPV